MSSASLSPESSVCRSLAEPRAWSNPEPIPLFDGEKTAKTTDSGPSQAKRDLASD
jgi:hypothetical protein